MPSNVPNKPTVDFPAQSVIVDTLIRARTSSFVGTAKPIEPGTPFRPLNHSVAEALAYANTIFLGQKMGADNEFQELIWATVPATQDIYGYSVEYSGKTAAAPIFKRRYLELRDTYAPRADLSLFTGVYAVKITNGGIGYSTDPNNPPTVTITDSGSGVNATAIAITNSAGAIVKITLKAEGVAYTPSSVGVTITDVAGGTGSGAAATAVVQPPTCMLVDESAEPAPEPWGSLYLLVTRSYETLPGPLISGTHVDPESGIVTNYTKQITATNTVVSGKTGAGVITLIIQNPGTGFTGNPTLAFSAPPSGVTATGTATFSAPSPAGKIGSVLFSSGGAGYTSAPTVSINIISGGGSGASIRANLVPSFLASVLVTAGGSGYTDAPVVTIGDNAGTGTGATAQAFLVPGTVDTVTVDVPGIGYSAATAILVGGGGTGATASVTIGATTITAISITNAGTGYTSAPQVVISGDGVGASAHSNLVATSVDHITVTATGNNYGDATAALSGGGGSGATANALLNPTAVGSFTVVSGGSGYSVFSTSVSGGGGTGAGATAVLASGTITGKAITNPGSNYLVAPTVTVSGGGGTGAVILAAIGSQSYVEREPLSALKDLVLRTTVDISTFPATATYPLSFRVSHGSIGISSLVLQPGTEGRVAVGLQEFNVNGGSGPALAFRDEAYMTDSQFAAFLPGAFSVTGRSTSATMIYAHIDDNGTPSVHTFRPLSIDSGTSVGILEISDSQKPYGYRKVLTTYLRTAVTTNILGL